MTKKIKLDSETADRITADTLINYRDSLKKELKKHRKNPKTDLNPNVYWLHPENVIDHQRRIDALNLIINDYTLL